MRQLSVLLATAAVGAAILAPASASSPDIDNGCDFNGDGWADLARYAHGEDLDGLDGVGALSIYHGSPTRPLAERLLHQDSPGVRGVSQGGEAFGVNVCADFDGNGHDDLAVGARETLGGIEATGAIHVFYAGDDGISVDGDDYLTQRTSGIPGAPQESDDFGRVLGTGDFNGDGYDDLAVGLPRHTVGEVFRAGRVKVIYGSSSGLDASTGEQWHLDRQGIAGAAVTQGAFGSALAVADFDGDNFDDLAVGVPGHDTNAKYGTGAVSVIFGSSSGLTVRDQFVHQASPGIKDRRENGDAFGSGLASGDIDADGYSDLVIGVPGERAGGGQNAGGVHIIFGSADGLSQRDQFLTQHSSNILDSSETNDRFGQFLALGDIDNDGYLDIVVGVNAESVDGYQRAGLVHVLFGSASKVTRRDQVRHQGQVFIRGELEGDKRWAERVEVVDLDNDGFSDVIVRSRNETIDGQYGAGAFQIIYGGPSGLTKRDRLIGQGALDEPEFQDFFG